VSAAAQSPSPETPLEGGCLCGAVRFEVSAPFVSAMYCHCTHCQKRTGTGSSVSGRVPREGFRLVQGAEALRSFQPAEGIPKVFCERCGSHLFAGEPLADELVAIRLGALEGDPGIRPSARQYLRSAAVWEPLPDDGLDRFDGPRP
jgi:hypothetical protein